MGTPTYIYDAAALDAAVDRWTEAMPADRISYAVKANGNLEILRRLETRGLGFEVSTPGEHARVRTTGVAPDRIVFGGVPKSPEAIAVAIRERVGLLVVQAENELELLAASGAREDAPLRVGVRVRPGIRAGAHPYLHTGTRAAKFGFSPGDVPDVWRRLARLETVRPVALAAHLGSGLEDTAPYARALEVLLDVARSAGRGGPAVEEIDLGGGLGIRYDPGGDGEPVDPDPAALAPLAREVEERGMAARFEPGRSIVGRCGLLLTRVLYRWNDGQSVALVCDAGFTDFSRFVLYEGSHRIEPVHGSVRGEPTVDVLGPTCESGDRLGTGQRLHGVSAGELLVLRDAGAYGFVMASNYMSRPRPPEVLLEGGGWHVVREREAVEDLWRGETVVAEPPA